jgi:hypothetical protein
MDILAICKKELHYVKFFFEFLNKSNITPRDKVFLLQTVAQIV